MTARPHGRATNHEEVDTMATQAMPRTTTRFGGLQLAICVLVGLTALVHLAIGAFTNCHRGHRSGPDREHGRR
jgi:hypothetical protein